MTTETPLTGPPEGLPIASKRGGSSRLMGSLREALIAAGRDDSRVTQIQERATHEDRDAMPTARIAPAALEALKPPQLPAVTSSEAPAAAAPMVLTPPSHLAREHVELDPEPPTDAAAVSAPPRTQLVRGRSSVKRTEFHQDPIVGWLVIVGGPGLGAYRAIYEGNNTIGRGATQRIPLDFGDDAISSEEQAYLRYDSVDRKFLLVPNLAKTNIVAVNEKKPTGAVELSAMDLITVGRTQLAFVPFCGQEFDWSELGELKG